MSQDDGLHRAERSISHVLDNGLIRVSTVIAGIAFVAAASWSVASWFTKIEAQLEHIEEQIQRSTEDRWRRTDMLRWCRETELQNPDWKCGEIE